MPGDENPLSHIVVPCQSATFGALRDAFVDEARRLGWELYPDAAADVLSMRIRLVAHRFGISAEAVIDGHMDEDSARHMARNSLPPDIGPRVDDMPVEVPVGLAGLVVADLAQAARLLVHNEQRRDLTNLVADALVRFGLALSQASDSEISMDPEGLRTAALALRICVAGITAGWELKLEGTPETLAQLLGAMYEKMNRNAGELEALLPEATAN
jgi:hypothetical protein